MAPKRERDLFQQGQCREDGRWVSQSQSPKYRKCFQVYVRKSGTEVGGSWKAGSEGQSHHCLGVNPGRVSRGLSEALIAGGGSSCSHQRMLGPQGLPPEPRDPLERRTHLESLRSEWQRPSPLQFLWPFPWKAPCTRLHSAGAQPVPLSPASCPSSKPAGG